MRKRAAAALITLALLVAAYGLLLSYVGAHKKTMPAAVNGAMDLSAWRFDKDGIVELDGQWELYPNRLLTVRDWATSAVEAGPAPTTVQVPGSWSKQMGTLGMATYRLRIRVGEAEAGAIYGLKTASITIANRLIVNGQVVGSSGIPAEKPDYKAVNRPYVGYFALQPGWNEIWLQAANYEYHASSGLIEPLLLGTAKQIAGVRDRATAHDWVALTAFLIMGLYFIGLFTQRRNDLSLAVLGGVCVCIALFTSVSGERVLFAVVGELPFRLYYRIQMVSVIVVGLGFYLYIYTAFRPYCSKRFVRGAMIVGAILAVLHAAFAPQLTVGLFRQFVSLYSTFSLLYATYVFVLAALHRMAGSVYLALAAMALNVLALNQNMNFYFGAPIYTLPPIEPFIVLLMLALLMSLRFSNAFRQIEELSGRLLQADKMKDEFLARTSHEFKTPLHGVMNIARSMLDDAAHPPSAEQREKVQLITDITRRLSQLVYDILDLSKLKAGELRIAPEAVDVRSVAEMQVRFYSYLCDERHIRLLNEVPADLPAALADESRLSQIIGNLLDNAIKHTESGSIVVSGTERGGRLEIAVRDTGKGIEARDLPLIFEPFRSLDGAERSAADSGWGCPSPSS